MDIKWMVIIIVLILLLPVGFVKANCLQLDDIYSDSKKFNSYEISYQEKGMMVSIIKGKNEFKNKLAKTKITEEKNCYFNPSTLSLVLLFDFDGHSLNEEQKNILKQYAKLVKNESQILIEGHADQVGEKPYNYELSRKRSNEVMGFLNEIMVDGYKLKQKNWGEMSPICTEKKNKELGCNRRVVILPVEVENRILNSTVE
ncbi:hypothetical protein BIT28_04495 [Photobacterium proteolyticum]|uniref:OmpA-like domain-containing protein n=1 Tax=Photobacterium proteolyticum TaxID=1903952 RepID=A0A1Q9H1U8_9GAMM|nr:OmpA family protein [Photobacterium proteolyticum]OLQ81646.1 hypothetical protein BIT28_04495 [Photobacterium proteolyticum]